MTDIGTRLLGLRISVRIVNTTNYFAACYGNRQLDLNLMRLGKSWFGSGINIDVDELLIHELGHHYCENHLDNKYHKACCMLGAKLKELALKEPDLFKYCDCGHAAVEHGFLSKNINSECDECSCVEFCNA